MAVVNIKFFYLIIMPGNQDVKFLMRMCLGLQSNTCSSIIPNWLPNGNRMS